jgi:hypothetical protein
VEHKECDVKTSSKNRPSWGQVPVWRVATLMGFFAMCVVFSLLSEYFLTFRNLISVLRQISILGVISVGITIVQAAGEFDLSPGYFVGLIGVVSAGVMRAGGGTAIAILAALVLGALLGAMNGGLAWRRIRGPDTGADHNLGKCSRHFLLHSSPHRTGETSLCYRRQSRGCAPIWDQRQTSQTTGVCLGRNHDWDDCGTSCGETGIRAANSRPRADARRICCSIHRH